MKCKAKLFLTIFKHKESLRAQFLDFKFDFMLVFKNFPSVFFIIVFTCFVLTFLFHKL